MTCLGLHCHDKQTYALLLGMTTTTLNPLLAQSEVITSSIKYPWIDIYRMSIAAENKFVLYSL